MPLEPSLLIVEDEKHSREGLRSFLVSRGYEIFLAEDGKTALEMIRSENPDVVLADLKLPDIDGIELLEKIKEISRDTCVIILTAYGTVENAVEAMKMGAFHYLTKPINFDELETILDRARRGKQLERENRELRRELAEKGEVTEISAHSPLMQEVIDVVKRVAPTGASVLIQGESGTGKEVVAHMIHEWSTRKDKPFVVVHCAALTESLLSSELFGHEKGAFTGATERKIGRFERAHAGTLFLDEVGEIKADLQVKLLRVLQNGEFERVGGTKLLRADVRLICATNKDLMAEVRNGRFREDLYYRINVIRVEVPPLRDHREDIPHLAEHFIRYYALINNKPVDKITDKAVELLVAYPWPGNVRELKNIIERMVVLSTGRVLAVDNLPYDIREAPRITPTTAIGPSAVENSYQLRDMEKELIQRKLHESKGNKSKAAKELGISRRTLYRKLQEYRIA